MPEWMAYVSQLRDYLINALAQYPTVRFNSPIQWDKDLCIASVGNVTSYSAVEVNPFLFGEESLRSNPYILNISVDGVRGTAFRDALDRHGVCVSVKAACATDNTPSRPVQATSDKKNALSSWRISLSHLTTHEEIDAFLHIFNLCHTELTAQ